MKYKYKNINKKLKYKNIKIKEYYIFLSKIDVYSK